VTVVRWWAGKGRQFFAHLRASVTPADRAIVAGWLTPPQLALFDAMHVADRRHGLDVVASLRASGVTDADVLVAGLLHDAGKADTGVWRVAGVAPGMRASLERLLRHAETSATLAARAGCSPRTVELIRNQDAPVDPEFGELLRLADEAN
jgi:hypothetical protein